MMNPKKNQREFVMLLHIAYYHSSPRVILPSVIELIPSALMVKTINSHAQVRM